MKKLLSMLVAVVLIALSGQLFAANELKIGKKIYDRAFGRGCGTCHDIASNPQLKKLIKAGKLNKKSFAKTIKKGKKGMPMAITTIMKVGPVKKAGYTEDQAINALYKYLSK